jgi:hypothetical protein
MNYIKAFVLVLVLSFLCSCGTRVPVVKMQNIDPATLAKSKRVKVYVLGQDPGEFEYIDSITAWSVKHMLYDPPATRGNAIEQAKVICVEKGGDAIMNVTFDEQGTDTWGTNAWESISLSADVIKLKNTPKTQNKVSNSSTPVSEPNDFEAKKKQLLDMYLKKEISKEEYYDLRRELEK